MNLFQTLQDALSKPAGGGAPQNAAPGDMGAVLAAAFHSKETPPFSEYVGQLFGQSSPSQKAGLLNQILAGLGPAGLSGMTGGVLGQLLAPGQTQLTPEQAAQVTQEQAASLAGQAEDRQPAIVDQVAQFYSQHSGLINALGAAALTFGLAKMKENQRK